MTDEIVTRLLAELSFIERHGTESLNDIDHALLLVAAVDEIERLRTRVTTWRTMAYDYYCEFDDCYCPTCNKYRELAGIEVDRGDR